MATPFIAEIVGFGGNFAPRGFALCQGQSLSIAQNTALFSLLGTTYGGNGQTTFNLPDLRGRAPIGQGAGPGLQPYALGQSGGAENATLTTANLPAHSHTTSASPTKGSLQAPAAGAFLGRGIDAGNTAVPQIYVPAGSEGTTIQLAAGGVTGSNQPFSIRDPYLTINWLIAIQGIFPSRN